MQLEDEKSNSSIGEPRTEEVDYYDVLQIGPKADTETIHRVFRIMAARFHPDNVETGDLGRFLSLKQAYETLSNPERREAYDALCKDRDLEPMPIFELRDFVTGVEAETNRRLGILSLLYNQRRRDPEHPGVSLLDLEQRMAFPREYLTFAVWYLRAKDFVTVADNSDFALTAGGADYVESNAAQNQVLSHLLQSGSARSAMHFQGSPDPRTALCGQPLRLESGREQATN